MLLAVAVGTQDDALGNLNNELPRVTEESVDLPQLDRTVLMVKIQRSWVVLWTSAATTFGLVSGEPYLIGQSPRRDVASFSHPDPVVLASALDAP